MYCEVTRRLELLQPMKLNIFNHYEDCPNSCDNSLNKSKGIQLTSSSKKHGALEKKYFFFGEVCPLYFPGKDGPSKRQASSPQGEVCPLSPRAW